MNITHIIPSLDPAAGGPPMVVLRLAAAQARLGHDVSIISFDCPDADQAISKAMKGVPYIDQVGLRSIKPGGALERVLGVGLKPKLRPLLAGQDVIQMHGVWETIFRVASGIALSQATPYVMMPHGMLDRWCMAQKRTKKRVAMFLACRKMLDRAAYLHALNEDEVGPIKELRISSPVHVIPNGVFLEEIEPLPRPGSYRAQLPQMADDPYILFLSRLHFKKGLDYLADAFAIVAAAHPNVRLVVAGPDGGVQGAFEQTVQQAGIADRVHLVGPIYGSAKYSALVDAACFCLPSRQEGFSIAITESLASGTPVVISEACHFPEVAQARAGFVLPLEPERFAQSLLTLLEDNALRDTMSGNARALVRERYTWPKIAEQSLACYRQEGCRDGS